MILSSRTGLCGLRATQPSHKWLGYFQKPGATPKTTRQRRVLPETSRRGRRRRRSASGRRFCRSRPGGTVLFSTAFSCGKLPVKFLVAANPNPNPHISLKSLRHGTVIPRHPHRPETRVGTQPFQLQGRMSRVLEKLLMRNTGRFFDAGRELMVSLPKLLRAQRFHFGYLKSPS